MHTLFFSVGSIEEPPAVLLSATDDLDLSTLAVAERELQAVMRPGEPGAVVVDVTGRFVAVRGVQLLVDTVEHAAVVGRRCAVAGLDDRVLLHLDLLGCTGVPLFRALPEALSALPRRPDVPARG